MTEPENQEQQRSKEAIARRLPASTDTTAKPGTTADLYSPSALVLIAANLIPLYGVIVLHWPAFPLLLLFWLENAVIGVFNALRLLLVNPAHLDSWGEKLFIVPFFCLHYGFFTAGHGNLLVGLFGGKTYSRLDHGLIPVNAATRTIADYDLWFAIVVLACSHAFSFVWNYLVQGEFRRVSLLSQMWQPYKRILMLHVTILVGGGIAMFLGSPVWALLLLIILKIGFDLNAHVKEHARAAD